LLSWYDEHGRIDLPWQNPRHPYRVWISEIMLQQTQVQTVIPYFNKFIANFPTLRELANAKEDEVLALWSGLGYYSRARNLYKAAKIMAKDYEGQLPQDLDSLISLPGIGASTAAAITSQAYGQPTPILDANVKRVLARYFQVDGAPDKNSVKNTLWELAGRCMSLTRSADYTQAIMDLGALICKPRKPLCPSCPINSNCLAFNNRLVDKYPEKKHKKPIPTEHQQFLLLYNKEQCVYLEKRPPTGIWGGLWSLPSLAMDQSPLTYVQDNYDLQAKSVCELQPFKHTFSHFHLQLYPLTIEVESVAKTALKEPQGLWFSKSELTTVGLAKPISKILTAWFSNF
jgi:A/G-specific adenine glycosylase